MLFANAVMAALLLWLGGDTLDWLALAGLGARVAPGGLRARRRGAYFAALFLAGTRLRTRAQRGRGIIAVEFVRGLQGLKPKHRGAAITVGSFDGIHLGHGALIASTCGLAKQLARPAMMLTFEPLPREYLAPPGSAGAAHGFSRALARARALGPALRVRAALRREAAAVDGEQFVELLTTRFAASAVVVGQDFRFGRGGAGSITLLRAAAEAGRFELELVPSVCIDDIRVSSSGVRTALAAGDFHRARDLLGPCVFDVRARGARVSSSGAGWDIRRRTSACGAASCR